MEIKKFLKQVSDWLDRSFTLEASEEMSVGKAGAKVGVEKKFMRQSCKDGLAQEKERGVRDGVLGTKKNIKLLIEKGSILGG